jgi:hypothetical protein
MSSSRRVPASERQRLGLGPAWGPRPGPGAVTAPGGPGTVAVGHADSESLASPSPGKPELAVTRPYLPV